MWTRVFSTGTSIRYNFSSFLCSILFFSYRSSTMHIAHAFLLKTGCSRINILIRRGIALDEYFCSMRQDGDWICSCVYHGRLSMLRTMFCSSAIELGTAAEQKREIHDVLSVGKAYSGALMPYFVVFYVVSGTWNTMT